VKELLKEAPAPFFVVWVLGALFSVAFWGFIVWAIYTLVTYVTGG